MSDTNKTDNMFSRWAWNYALSLSISKKIESSKWVNKSYIPAEDFEELFDHEVYYQIINDVAEKIKVLFREPIDEDDVNDHHI